MGAAASSNSWLNSSLPIYRQFRTPTKPAFGDRLLPLGCANHGARVPQPRGNPACGRRKIANDIPSYRAASASDSRCRRIPGNHVFLMVDTLKVPF